MIEVSYDPYESDPVCGARSVHHEWEGGYMATRVVSVRCVCGVIDDFRIGVSGWMRYECACGRTGEINCDSCPTS